MTDINDGLPPNDLRLFLRTISMATPEQVIRLGSESADHIDALEASNKALVGVLTDYWTGNHFTGVSINDAERISAALAAAQAHYVAASLEPFGVQGGIHEPNT